MIDTHAHLTDERLMGQIDDVLRRAKEAGVERVVVPGTSLEDSIAVVELVNKYENVYGLVGIHPENLGKFNGNNIGLLIENNMKVVGIGEIGLDFHYDPDRKTIEKQIEIFRSQMDMAIKLKKPVVIHSRDADPEMRFVVENMAELPSGQFHCFAGSDDFLKLILDRGFYVSFCGNITYPSAGALRDQIRKVPLDKLLLETDSPYLTPEPMRGSLNEPANVKILAEFIAEQLGINLETLISQTTANAKCLFFGG